MIESAFNVNKIINEKKQDIIESFIMFYGEEERERITQKFNSTPFIGYLTYGDIIYKLFGKAERERDEVVEKYFFDKIGITENIDEVKKRLFPFGGFGCNSNPILNFNDLYSPEDHSTFVLNALKKIVDKEDLTWDDPNINEYISYALSLKKPYDEASKLFNNYLNEKYGELVKCSEQCKNIRQEAENEIKEEYFKYIYPKLSNEDKIIYDSFDSQSIPWDKMKSAFLYRSGKYNTIPSVDSISFFNFFTTKSEEELNNSNTPSYQIDSIKNERIEYFKLMTDLSFDTYEEYISNPEIQSIIPDKNLCDEIVKEKDKLIIKTEKLYIEKNPLYEEAIRIIKSKNYLLKYDILTNIMINELTCVNLNFVESSGKIKLSPFVFVQGNLEPSVFDLRLIHECNHLYELTLTKIDGSMLECTGGWDVLHSDIDKAIDDDDLSSPKRIRKYEAFNEIINDLIAVDITKIMHDNNKYIIGDEKTSLSMSNSNYQMMTPLIIDFYNTFKKEIIASRKNGDLSPITDRVGQENFDALNDLLNNFFNRFRIGIWNVKMELRQNKDTDNTRYYKSCIKQSKEIFEKMQSYSFNRSL